MFLGVGGSFIAGGYIMAALPDVRSPLLAALGRPGRLRAIGIVDLLLTTIGLSAAVVAIVTAH
jgi:hypothetical protein